MTIESPLVTVVTITYNLIEAGRKETFLQCVESVKNQTYKNIEHIIIDGASDDGTLELIQSTGLKYYSEPDSGIYDAMNKGIDRAQGEYITFLHSDDYYSRSEGISKSIELLLMSNADYCFGDVDMKKDSEVTVWEANLENIAFGTHYCHQSLFTKTSVIKEIGGFDLSYKISSDSDMMIKLYKSYIGIKNDFKFVVYRFGGISTEHAGQVREDHSSAFYKLIGNALGLSQEDCYMLYGYKYREELSREEYFKITRKVNLCEKFRESFFNAPTNHKIKILFNAEVHLAYNAKNSFRTGIYFVEDNILKEFAKYPFLEISLTAPTHGLHILEEFLKDNKEALPNVNIYYGERKEFDIYFSPFFEIPKNVRETSITRYTIAYDLIQFVLADNQYAGYKDSRFYKNVESWAYDDNFFSISDYTKSDLLKYLPHLDANKITTTLLAASDNFYQDLDKEKHIELRKKYNIPQDKKYIFSLCTLEPRKNLIFSIKNFVKFIEKNNIEDLVFVLGGGHWDKFIEKLNSAIRHLDKYKDKIIKAGYVDDEDLASLYSNAECTVYTTIYEGFGLPPLEAMQCGCPVITSNTTSLPEVVGDAGIMIDPTDDNALIEAYEKLYFDSSLREELSKKGIKQAKLFSWKKTADIMVEQFCSRPYSTVVIELPIVPREQKTKIYLFNLPIYRMAKTPTVKRINILGIPCYKVKIDTIYKRAYLFNLIQLYKYWKKDNIKRIHLLGLPFIKVEKRANYKKINLFDFYFLRQKINNFLENKPKVTVITITYNLINVGRKECFLQCVESVKNQTYQNIEHIIIDGASNDGTLELIQSTGIKYYSEPDSGIYDAMNKGIDRATGKYIAFLNSDDFWHGVDGVRLSVKALEKENADFSYGTAVYLDENDNYLGVLEPVIGSFYMRMPFSHQTMFTKTSYIRSIGKFDENYNSAADYDLILRLMLDGAKPVFVPKVFTTYRLGGLSDTHREQSVRECALSFEKNYSKITSEKYDYTEIFNLIKFPTALYDKVYEKINPAITLDVRKSSETSELKKGFYYVTQYPLLSIPEKEQKTKINFFNLPIYRMVKTPTVKRISILGIPCYKVKIDTIYKRAYLFNCIQLCKWQKDPNNPNKRKVRLLGFISCSYTKKDKRMSKRKYPKWLVTFLCVFIPSKKNRKNLRDNYTKPSVRDLIKTLEIETIQNQERLHNEILQNQERLHNEILQNQERLHNEILQNQERLFEEVVQNQNSIKNKLIRVQQESITSLANIEDISNKLLKKIEGLVAVNNKNLYYSTNEAYMLKHAFKNFSIADERIYTMLQDLDLQSAENLWRIITRIERAKHSEGMHIDLFTQEEKKKLTSLDENLHGAIIQLAPDIYSYKNKLLPIKDFEVGVFDYFHGIFELSPHLIEQIKNGVILDVGAYIGDSALALSGVFPNAHILSFEAIPNNVLLANKTIEMNNLTNVELIPTALADRQGNSFIFSNGIGSSLVTTECEGSIEIPIDTLDNVVRKKQLTRINVIKVDIEGGEQAFLRGAKETIEKYRPVLLISIYHSWNDFMQIKPLIDSWNLNYRFKIVRPVDGYIFIDTLLICEPQ